jgi:transposase
MAVPSTKGEEVHGMLYVGVDAHRRVAQITVMNSTGTVLRRARISSSQEALHEVLSQYREPKKAVLEASYSWAPMYDWLGEMTDSVVLAHPAKVRAIAEARVKTDAIDSEMLAHLLRANLIPEAYAPSKRTRQVKRVLRQRMFFVRLRTMLKNRTQALLAQYPLERPQVSDLYGRAGRRWLGTLDLPAPDQELLEEGLLTHDFLCERIRASDKLIRKVAAGDKAVRLLRTLPGIGEFFSVLIRYEVDDVRRFRAAGKLAGFTGLVPSTYASANRVVHGRLTKQGNKWLRWAFVEAVSPAVRSSLWLNRYYQRIKKRRGSKDARTATARKLTHLAWSVWTENRAYEER